MVPKPTAKIHIALAVLGLSCASPEDVIDRTPTISLVTPSEAAVGDTITISGKNFGIGGPRDAVFIGAAPLPIEVWSNTSIEVRLETEAVGHRLVLVQTGGQTSNPMPIEIRPFDTGPHSTVEIDDESG